MPDAIDGGRAEQFIGEGIAPLVEVQVAGDDGRAALVTLSYQVVDILILGGAQWFEAEVVDDQQIDLSQGVKSPFVGVGCAGGVEVAQHFGLGGEEYLVAHSDRAVADSLGDMTLAGAAGTDHQQVGALFQEAAGGQVYDQGAVDFGVEGEVELLQGFMVAEVGATDTHGELALGTAGDLILDQDGQEVGVGQLFLDGLAVSGLH